MNLQRQFEGLPRQARAQTNYFLFIASDLWLGGIASYIESLAHGLMSLGDAVRLLAVFRPDERVPTHFLQEHESWSSPFQLVRENRPTNWLLRKSVSLLDILRCLSPTCRRVLEKTSLFKASKDAIVRFERLLSQEKPTVIVFGNFDERLYPLALPLLERHLPYGIIAHGCEICRPVKRKRTDLVQREILLKGASWIAANSHHTKSLLLEELADSA